MTHISILDEEIKGLDDIKARLEERDTTVSVIKSFEDLKNLQTCTLVVSEKKVSSDNEIINVQVVGTSLELDKLISEIDANNPLEIVRSGSLGISSDEKTLTIEN